MEKKMERMAGLMALQGVIPVGMVFPPFATEDMFSGARELTGASGTSAFTNVGYGVENGEPGHTSDGYAGGSVKVAPVADGEGEGGTLRVFQSSLSFGMDRAAAMERAREEGKRVLLFYGREGCGNCFATMMDDLPSDGGRERVEAGHEMWYVNCDRDGWWDASPFWTGLSSISLPMLCTIDPSGGESMLKRTTGFCHGLILELPFRPSCGTKPKCFVAP